MIIREIRLFMSCSLIRHAGIEATVIEYLRTPPTRANLLDLLTAMRAPVRWMARVHSPHGADLGLFDPRWSDEALLDLVLTRPVFLNRPIVVTPPGTKLQTLGNVVGAVACPSACAIHQGPQVDDISKPSTDFLSDASTGKHGDPRQALLATAPGGRDSARSQLWER
jgi:arsenate reductase-like glutaredoxin family protein